MNMRDFLKQMANFVNSISKNSANHVSNFHNNFNGIVILQSSYVYLVIFHDKIYFKAQQLFRLLYKSTL